MSPTTIALGILALAGVLVVVFLVANANRRRHSYEDVPPAMRPGYSDEQLERTILERYMGWGLVLTTGLAIFVPVYFLNERNRLQGQTEDLFISSVVRGEDQYVENCAECHGEGLGGGAAVSPYDPEASWPAPALNTIATRYAESPNVTDVHDFVVQTLQRGRPGTPMPTWGAAYGGPMTDQQIEDITNYILANQITPGAEGGAAEGQASEGGAAEGEASEGQASEGQASEGEASETEDAEAAGAQTVADASGEELYQGNCAKCHGAELQGIVGPSLIGVTERHSRDDILGILTNGIYMPTGAVMPPFGEQVWQYEGARYDAETLEKIVDYLEEAQPAEIPEDALQYQTPGVGQAEAASAASDDGS